MRHHFPWRHRLSSGLVTLEDACPPAASSLRRLGPSSDLIFSNDVVPQSASLTQKMQALEWPHFLRCRKPTRDRVPSKNTYQSMVACPLKRKPKKLSESLAHDRLCLNYQRHNRLHIAFRGKLSMLAIRLQSPDRLCVRNVVLEHNYRIPSHTRHTHWARI